MRKIIKLIYFFIITSIIFSINNISYADIVSNYVWEVQVINDWDFSWTNANNIIWDDTSSFWQVNMSNNPSVSDTLILKWFDLKSQNIPVWSTINWIQIEVEWQGSSTRVTDFAVELTKNWNDSYTSNLANNASQTTKNITIYGSNTELWWTTWSDTEIKSNNFWILLKYRKTGWWTRNARVYRANLIVDYTPPLEETPISFNTTNENYWNTWFCYEFNATNNSTLNITNWEIWFKLNWANITSSWWWNFTNLWWWEYIITSPGTYADTFSVWQTLSFWLCADSWIWYISNLITKNYQNIWWLVLQDYNLTDNWLDVSITTNNSWAWWFCRDITLTNNWNTTINGWQLNFELDQALSSSYWWNYSQNTNIHTITPLSYNKIINPWETHTIWFCSNWTNVDSNWNLNTLIWTPWFCWKYYTWTATEPYNLINFVNSQTDYEVRFDWWNLSPNEQLPNDDFTVEWEWKFQADESWNYTFRTRSDDWVRLYIDWNIIIDQWVDQAPTIVTWNINLNQWQIYNIRLEYYERWGWAVVELDWQKPSDSWFVNLNWNNIFHWDCSWWIFAWLETTFAWWNWQRWNMFDIEVLDQSITIKWFSINPQTQTWDIRIYYKSWTYAWFETDSTAWTLLWDYSFNWWPWQTFVQTDELILNENSNYSFYILNTSWDNLSYTNWSTEWSIYSQDNFLIFREWIWVGNEFWPNTWRPRIWNGIIHYDVNFTWNVESWLETTFAWWNWQAGNMFEIDILNNDVIVNALSINTRTANSSLRVYYKQWSYAWFESAAAWWTLVWDYPFTWAWEWNPTYIEIDNLNLNSNTTYSFYVTEVWTSWIRYTNWTTEWNIFAQDAFIIFREGIWKVFEFQNSFSPRIWNGIIHYTAILDTTEPTIDYNNISNNDLLPNSNKSITIDYNDESWLDLNTINASLSKWNWTSWWNNILATYQTSVSNNINQSTYNISPLWYGKYRFRFSIDDNWWNTSTKDLIFYIDEPEFLISDSIIDIWNINNLNTNKFSPDLFLTVNTVWAWFDIQMNKSWELNYSWLNISDWNWTNGFWYDWEPITNTINTINQNQLIVNQAKNININWEKNTYIYSIRFWANINENIAAWSYSWNIDFDIIFDY